MKADFPTITSHLTLAHFYWAQYLRAGDSAIDATCGNGLDTLQLCRLALTAQTGHIYAYDIQAAAIEATRTRLQQQLPAEHLERVTFVHGSHQNFAEVKASGGSESESGTFIKLFVYNLGYLPGGNKNLTTLVGSTLESIETACQLLQPGGLISITCYPGHEEGKIEEEALLNRVGKLPRNKWNCVYHRWVNRCNKAPSLLLLEKKL